MRSHLKVNLLILAASVLMLASGKPYHVQDHSWVVRRVTRDSNDLPQPSPSEAENVDVKKAQAKNTPPEIYSMNIQSNIRLRYATTKVTSRVVNAALVSQETTFHVVLPDSAYISGFIMEINGTSYAAQVKEKEQAQTEYEAAVNLGQTAAHVSTSARDANQFTVAVNIEPEAKVTFNLTYDELLTRRRGVYEHQIHINPGKIIPELTVSVAISEVLPILDIHVPQIRKDIQKDLEEEGVNELAKVTRVNATDATIVFEPSREQQKIFSLDGLQGQFVVQYDVDRSAVEKEGGEMHVIDGYFVHFFAPSSLPSIPKHVVFVLDTSGSMEGVKLEQTKQAMGSILDQLRPDDIFSVIEFSSKAQEWNLSSKYEAPDWVYDPPKNNVTVVSEPVTEPFGPYDDILAYPASKTAIDRAKFFTSSMRAAGGTNINEALLRALNNSQSVQSKVQSKTPMIIFLTDGDPSVGVTSTDAIATNVKKANNDGIVSIFSLAFGNEADFSFLKKISTQNKAFARKIYEASDATIQLKGFFSEVSSPVLSNVKFNYEGTVTNITDSRVGNFFNGSEVVVAGRLNDTTTAAATVRAVVSGLAAGGKAFESVVDASEKSVQKSGKQSDSTTSKPPTKLNFSLEKTWAYLTIKDLLRKGEVEDKATYKKDALALSLKYKFVTPLTSLLIIGPNKTTTSADLKAADPSSSNVAVGLRGTGMNLAAFGPIKSFLSQPAPVGPTGIISAAPADAFEAAPEFFVNPVQLAEEEEEDVPDSLVPAISATTSAPKINPQPTITTDVPRVSTTTKPFGDLDKHIIASRPKWYDFDGAFDTNSTHVTLAIDGQNRTLSWVDKLPEKNYQSCKATYKVRTSDTAFCRSVWKCPTLVKSTAQDYCVIENSYVGVCCVSEPQDEEVKLP